MKIPINIQKIKLKIENNRNRTVNSEDSINYHTRYLFTLNETGELWQKTFNCGRDELLYFRNKIDELLRETTTAEIFNISDDKAKIIDDHYKSDKLCENCVFKNTQICIQCLFVIQSPLERIIFIELSREGIRFKMQYPLNWNGDNISIEGKSYENEENNFKEVLTVVDFYIEKRGKKLCIYTDGHTFHEKTEEKVKKDKIIDRKLQELGFIVLRYTGLEVKEDSLKIIKEIKKWVE